MPDLVYCEPATSDPTAPPSPPLTLSMDLPEGDGDPSPQSPIYSMYHVLRELCCSNAEHFRSDDSESGQRLYGGCVAVVDHLEVVLAQVDKVRKIAPAYDLDSDTPGNGYRSFVAVVDSFVLHCVKLSRQICLSRDSFIFRKGHYVREIESCAQLMASLGTCLHHLQTLWEASKGGSLFPTEPISAEELLLKAENINQYCFYGRCLGFQFCESMQKILKFLAIAMASFSEIYYSTGGIWSRAKASLFTGSRYMVDPELRARRIVNISQYGSVDFCKSFWLLQETELMQQLPGWVCPSVTVNKVIAIPTEALHLTPDGTPCDPNDANGITIPPPQSHIGTAPVNVRLISLHRREGMIGSAEAPDPSSVLPPSAHLLIHCHGGGFVAQSSKSHEVYLRDWASQLDCPFLSVDYSLAPEAPYPRALEEVLYAYCWALANARMLGSTAQVVVVVGDSAGATLLMGAVMRLVEMGIRKPDGMLLAYMPVLVQFVPSPSRLLCLMDPLLPFGFMMRCLEAYTGFIAEGSNGHEPCSEAVLVGSDSMSSFEEVSGSELTRAVIGPPHSPSHLSDAGSDTLTTITLASETSKQDGDGPILSEGGANSEGAGRRSSRQYVSDFLQKYILDTDGKVPLLRSESAGSDPDEQVLFEMPTEIGTSLPSRLGQAASRMASGIASKLRFGRSGPGANENGQPERMDNRKPRTLCLGPSQLDSHVPRSPSEEFRFTVPQDHYLSPYLAGDDLLKKLPPMNLVSVQLDPCLDDCVMFAKKLRRLGNEVGLDILDGLPHGFLNFSMVSKEAHDGSRLCLKRIRTLLKMDG